MKSLDMRYSSTVLSYLSENEPCMMTDLLSIVTSHATLGKLIESLEGDGLIETQEKIVGRRTYSITLTNKGRTVAAQIKKARDVSATGEIIEVPKEWKERWKNISELVHINVYEDHITVQEKNYNGTRKDRIFNIYVKPNGHGIPRLFCELDESFDCYHIGYAWTLTDVQDMMKRLWENK